MIGDRIKSYGYSCEYHLCCSQCRRNHVKVWLNRHMIDLGDGKYERTMLQFAQLTGEPCGCGAPGYELLKNLAHLCGLSCPSLAVLYVFFVLHHMKT